MDNREAEYTALEAIISSYKHKQQTRTRIFNIWGRGTMTTGDHPSNYLVLFSLILVSIIKCFATKKVI